MFGKIKPYKIDWEMVKKAALEKEKKFIELETEIEKMKTRINSFHGLFNRISAKKLIKEEEERGEEEKPKKEISKKDQQLIPI